jgi:anthranilate synthase component 2
MPRLLMVNNYDSFTFNLVHLLEKCGVDEVVTRNNDNLDAALLDQCDAVVLSPGPGVPVQAGQMPWLISSYSRKKPMLGICLGLQAIAENFGYHLLNLNEVHHGLSENVRIVKEDSLFAGCPPIFKGGRYHSWIVQDNGDGEMETIAVDDTGAVMAMRHKQLPVKGLQFHPESILSEFGETIIRNWLAELDHSPKNG